MITFNPRSKIFSLEGSGTSYLLGISPRGDLHHLHWGSPLSARAQRTLLAGWRKKTDESASLMENQSREFADFGHNDLRSPAFQLEQAGGSRISRFTYRSHRITAGKPPFEGPSAVPGGPGESSTLLVTLRDRLEKLDLCLYYTLFPKPGILAKRAVLRNGGRRPLDILKFMSSSMDLPAGDRELVSFPGAWAKERRLQRQPLLQGLVRLESRRGVSSHEMNPFAMVAEKGADEGHGEVFGMALSYSGNWLLEAETQRDGGLRLSMGLNDFNFKWRLSPGRSFASPECLLAHSASGFGPLSLSLHRFVRRHVIRGEWRDRPRPILANNWEATYFKFNHGNILKIAGASRDLGVEMMVLDDGWFGKRDGDDSSLGDWFEDRRKLPRGVEGLSRDIHALGMKFGLWIEPEMVSPRSRLYRAHPDWCLHVPGRERMTFRHQLVLDMSRPEIRDYLFRTIGGVLERGRVDYVKWDMNRALSEVGSPALPSRRQGELYHRYMTGVYDLMDRFNRRFPHVLFEGCAGGGARFDMGLLSYHPQIWTSDNSDGLDRLFIQYGTSFAYPPLVMGAHIAASPNHITKRSTPLRWRALMAMSGNFGLELDVAKWNQREKREAAGYIALYKEIRPLVQFGDFHRLESPYDSPRASWMFTSGNGREALLFVFQVKPFAEGRTPPPIRLRGLIPSRRYEIEGTSPRLPGKRLMGEGWLPPDFRKVRGPFQCGLYRLKA
jgi:alpha-galactosidase